jgi:hypothetical protein
MSQKSQRPEIFRKGEPPKNVRLFKQKLALRLKGLAGKILKRTEDVET